MGTSGSAPDVTLDDARRVFSQLDAPGTPLTTAEVAAKLECSERTARQNLEALTEFDELRTRQIADRGQVWWECRDQNETVEKGSELREFGAFVRAVEDYAIFMLDPDGTVVSWNEGAGRIKGYSEDEIVGEHFSAFYTDADIDDGVPEANLETAADQGRTEDEGWRVRKDGSQFWADVVITAIRDENGSLQGFTKVTRDMTEQREYEQQLRREHDLTEQILETVPVSIGVIDSDGQFVRANQRMLERHGIKESDLPEYGLDSLDVYDRDGEPIPEEDWPFTRIIENGEPVYGFQCQLDLPPSGRQWLSINAAPLEGSPDEAERVVAAIDDITDQKERERRLRHEYEQTEKLLRTAPIPIAVQNVDGETVLANQRAQEALGLSEQDILVDSDDATEWDVYDTNGNLLPTDETPTARALASGEPVHNEELVIDPPNGERMQFQINATPVFGPEGSIKRVVTAGKDITELKEREQQLEQRKTELETELSEILGRIADAFYALDEDFRFTHVNDSAAELMQQSADELLGRKVWAVFPDAVDGVYGQNIRQAMETQEPVSFEEYEEEIDAWFEFNVYPSESGLSIYFRDITERREYEQKLEESNERLEQFAYAASHDLQEPLRMVSSYLQMIERRYGDELDEDGRDFIDFAVDGAERMRDMIEALLEYSRVQTQGNPFESIDLNSVLADVRDDMQFQIEESDAEISAESLPSVEGDPDQLRQVFQNLLDNAIEYSGDEPPRVHVTAELNANRWTISVSDEGIGIDSDDQDRIFEVFQRLHTNDEHVGTGIGLALCRRIIERHGGGIWVDSLPGEGSTFTFTLPVEE